MYFNLHSDNISNKGNLNNVLSEYRGGEIFPTVLTYNIK